LPATIVQNEKPVVNPALASWMAADQQTIIILHASLSEEAISMIVGLTTARNIWAALEAACNNSSVERVQNLQDQLRQTQKGEKSVAELGPTFETFSTYVRSSRHQPTFLDLLARAESHELFIKALHGSSPPTVAFSAQSSQQKNGSNSLTRGRRNYNNRGGYETLLATIIIKEEEGHPTANFVELKAITQARVQSLHHMRLLLLG
ncbi:putative RNA-directed DNA polymerase, partial [Tanacetum coccineum]